MKKLLFLFIFIGVSCSQEVKVQQKYYFDLATLLNEQVRQLSAHQWIITKKVSIDGKEELIQPQKLDWKKELELFGQADLNKPAYQLSYDKKETANERNYVLKNGENLPVKSLKIVLDSLSKKPKLVEATLQTKNYLYESRKHLWMKLQNGKITTYFIEGSQELFLGNKKTFSIEGEIKRF